MAILKFKDKGEWKSIAAFKGEDGKDGAIQYTAGPGIKIEDNIISATLDGEGGLELTVDQQPIAGSTNPVASGGVFTELANKADKSEIKTDTGELTNGAGFITGADIPKDLGDFDNEAGYITEESDPLFKSSAAFSVTPAHINLLARLNGYTIVPLDFSGLNFNSATANSISYTYKASTYYDKIIAYAGSLTKAILCVTTNGKSVMLFYHSYATTSSSEGITTFLGFTNVDEYGHSVPIRLKITANQKTGAHVSTEFRSMGSSYNNVTKGDVLTKTNTSSFTPTADYHPATKKYVDNAVAAGIAGVGGLTEEEDPTVPAWVKNITEEDIINWNNKADAGGIDQELDPTVPVWVKAITEDDIASWNNKLDEMPDISGDINNAIDSALAGAGYISKEEDPLFVNSPAASITDEDKTRWNNKLDANNIYHRTTYAYEIHNTLTNAQVEGFIPFLKNFLFKNSEGYIVTEHLPQTRLYRTLAPSRYDNAYYEIYASSPFNFKCLECKTCTVTEHIKSSESQADFMGGKLGTYDTYIEYVMEAINYAGAGSQNDQTSITNYICSYNDSDARYGQIQKERITVFFNINNVLSDNPDCSDIAIATTEYGAGFWQPGI